MSTQNFPANAIQAPKYAVCKHGRGHEAKCGYAHKLVEVCMPLKLIGKMWYCKAHLPQGPSGIDLFCGQQFTAYQYDRIMKMIFTEGIRFSPDWARMFAYFEGLGGANEYIHDLDFGLSFFLEQYSEKIFHSPWYKVEKTISLGTCEYPFPLAYDLKERTLAERMLARKLTATCFKVFRAVHTWLDEGGTYAASTPMYWGAQSQHYIPIHRGSTYFLIGESEEPVWYYVSRSLKDLLSEGGWCPPGCLVYTCDSEPVYEVTMPVLTVQLQPYLEPIVDEIPGSILEVFTDGSCNPCIEGDRKGSGIAAGWIAGGNVGTDRVSLAGVWAGAEISELLGIVGALQYLWSIFSIDEPAAYDTILLRIDSKNAANHVFLDDPPVHESGRYLLPAISLAKFLVCRFADQGIKVCSTHIASASNPADRIASHEQRRRRAEDHWDPMCDVWPSFLPAVWQNVFKDVSTNQVSHSVLHDDIDADVFMTI